MSTTSEETPTATATGITTPASTLSAKSSTYSAQLPTYDRLAVWGLEDGHFPRKVFDKQSDSVIGPLRSECFASMGMYNAPGETAESCIVEGKRVCDLSGKTLKKDPLPWGFTCTVTSGDGPSDPVFAEVEGHLPLMYFPRYKGESIQSSESPSTVGRIVLIDNFSGLGPIARELYQVVSEDKISRVGGSNVPTQILSVYPPAYSQDLVLGMNVLKERAAESAIEIHTIKAVPLDWQTSDGTSGMVQTEDIIVENMTKGTDSADSRAEPQEFSFVSFPGHRYVTDGGEQTLLFRGGHWSTLRKGDDRHHFAMLVKMGVEKVDSATSAQSEVDSDSD